MSFYDDASLIMYPSGYKEDKIYSLKPTNGTGDLNFSRASSATRVNSEGLIETATVFGSELVTNGDIESGLPTVNGNSFTQYQATISQSSAVAHASTNSMKVTGTGTLFNTRVIPNNASYVSKVFVVSLWVYNPTSLTGNIVVRKRINGIPSDIGTLSTKDTWTNFTYNTTSQNPSVDRFIEVEAQTGLNTEFFYVDDITIKEVITSNVPRIDYSNGCGSLLLEKQSTNLITYSEDFSNAAWTKTRCTITINQAISPDGTLNADLMTSTSADARLEDAAGSSGAEFTQSIYIKSAQVSDVDCQLDFAGLNIKTFTATQEWQRVDTTLTDTSQNPRLRLRILDSGNSVYIYGAQLEQSSYPTSYIISNSGTTTTRIADAASKTGLSSLIGQTEGTMFVDFYAKSAFDGTNFISTLSDGTSTNYIYVNRENGKLEVRISNGGVTQLFYLAPSILSEGVHKLALAYKLNDFLIYLDGVLVHSDTSGTVPSCNKMNLGSYYNGSFSFNDRINNSMLFKTSLTDDELSDLTGAVHQTFNSLATFYNYTIL